MQASPGGERASVVTGSVVGAGRLRCLVACGIFPDQRLNPCPLHCEVNSYPQYYKGSPVCLFLIFIWLRWVSVAACEIFAVVSVVF